ncbi:MAG: hypothetical protein R3F43_23940 [bacterium]
MVHLRGRRLGVVPLRLGLPGLQAVVDAADVEPDEAWEAPAEWGRSSTGCAGLVAEAVLPCWRRPRRAAGRRRPLRALAWALVGCAFPSPLWVELHRQAREARGAEGGEALYRDALRCLFQDAGASLRRVVAHTGIPASKLELAEGGPRHGRGDAFVRALFGNRWPLDGEVETPALDRLLAWAPALAAVPLVRTVGGSRLSLREVAERAPAGLPYRLRPTADTPADTLVPDATWWSLLEALFAGAWRDAGELEVEARRARALGLIAPRPRLGPAPGEALGVVRVVGEGFVAEVGLGPPGQPGTLTVCRGLRPVATVGGLPLPLVGGVDAPDEPLRFEGDRPVALVDPAGLAGRLAAVAGPAAVEALIADWPVPGDDRLPRARRLALALAREFPALEQVPVVDGLGGEAFNISDLRSLQADGRLRLATPEAVADGRDVVIRVEARGALESLIGAVPPWLPPPPPPPEAPAVPPADLLVQRVRAALDGDLAGLELDRLRAAPGDGKLPVRCGADGICLDTTHPLVARALAAADPVWDALVAMIAFGEVNRWLEEVTDAHEAELIGRVAARLRG